MNATVCGRRTELGSDCSSRCRPRTTRQVRSTGTSRSTPHHRARSSARCRRSGRTSAGTRVKGGRRGGTPGRDAVAEPGRPPGGCGAGGEGLGRSRGGFTSKLHLSADGRCRPLSLVVTGGQRADCTQFEPVLEKIRVPRSGPGRPRKKTDSQAARLRKGSRGGRPPGFDEDRYRKRNTVERAINRLKQSRAVATRMTSAATSTSAPPQQQPLSSGCERRRPGRRLLRRRRRGCPGRR